MLLNRAENLLQHLSFLPLFSSFSEFLRTYRLFYTCKYIIDFVLKSIDLAITMQKIKTSRIKTIKLLVITTNIQND